MAGLDQREVARILGSEIVGRIDVVHGAIGAGKMLHDAAKLRRRPMLSRPVGTPSAADREVASAAFMSVRDDEASADVWIADPDRNARYLAACRTRRAESSPYVLNKALMNLPRDGELAGLAGMDSPIDATDLDFAVQFAATKLRYLLGASVDDLLCDPALAAEFDRRASEIMPGRTPHQLRRALLRFRNRRVAPDGTVKALELEHAVPFIDAKAAPLPRERGVLLLRQAGHPWFAQGTDDLQRSWVVLRMPRVVESIVGCLFRPSDRDSLTLAFQPLPATLDFEQVLGHARRIAADSKPIFNVPVEV